METQYAALIKYFESIIIPIVSNPDSVKVEANLDEMGVLMTVDLHPEDMGVVIGRNGDTAKSIRSLLRIYGHKHDMRVNLKINEPEGSTRPRREFKRGGDYNRNDNENFGQ